MAPRPRIQLIPGDRFFADLRYHNEDVYVRDVDSMSTGTRSSPQFPSTLDPQFWIPVTPASALGNRIPIEGLPQNTTRPVWISLRKTETMDIAGDDVVYGRQVYARGY